MFRLGFDAQLLEPGEIQGSPQDYAQAMQAALPHIVQQHQQVIARAKNLFQQRDCQATATKVIRRMDELLASGEFFDNRDLCSDAEFKELLEHAASVDEGGNIEDAMTMYALLQVLRPDQPRPFINNFTLVWQTAGVKMAAECYALLAPVMVSPTYFYYAADCFEHAGLMDDARRAIKMAVEQLDDEELGFRLDPGFAQDIREYHAQLCESRPMGGGPGGSWIPV